MILITLLLVLTIERIAATTQIWQFSFYYQKYYALWCERFGGEKAFASFMVRWTFLLLPAVIIWVVGQSIDWPLVEFAFNTLVLLICIGCIHKRKLYKQFLNAANRGDEEACHLYGSQLRELESVTDPQTEKPQDGAVEQPQTQAQSETVVDAEFNQQQHQNQQALHDATEPNCDVEGHRLGLTLVWFNFKYYCATLFWFVVIGPAGAVAYCMLRDSFDDKSGVGQVSLLESQSLQRVIHILDWLPARVCSAGYLLIGDFTRSSGIWLGYLLDFKSPAKNLVCEIASAAEAVELETDNKILEPVCMLKLAKRNILFFLAMVAVLTLWGGLA